MIGNCFLSVYGRCKKIISRVSETFSLLQVIELSLWSPGGWLVITRCNLFRKVWLVDLCDTESDKVLSWNLKGMPARLYLGFNEWINEAKAIEWKPPVVTKWSMPFLCFAILNNCTSSFQMCVFVWEGRLQGILVCWLDKTILEDRTQNIQAARQSFKTQNPRWKMS